MDKGEARRMEAARQDGTQDSTNDCGEGRDAGFQADVAAIRSQGGTWAGRSLGMVTHEAVWSCPKPTMDGQPRPSSHVLESKAGTRIGAIAALLWVPHGSVVEQLDELDLSSMCHGTKLGAKSRWRDLQTFHW